MKEKILTISVAAYNVEKYIEKNLYSIINSEVIDKIEVFVVDDGGNDDTFEIAKSFEMKYPNSIRVVHKENGGYGSTVNYSIKHATGKYFKLLDGDDWVNSDGLKTLVEYLERTNVDVVVTNFCTGSDDIKMRLVDLFRLEGSEIKQISTYNPQKQLGMWSLTLKTEVIRAAGTILPEHCLYTDQFITLVPFSCAKDIKFLNTYVYCYRTDRQGQSTGRASRIKHVDEAIGHCLFFADFYEKKKAEGSKNCGFILQRAASLHKGSIKTILLMPINGQNLQKLKEHERRVREISSDVYKEAAKGTEMGMMLKLLRETRYLTYWLIKLIPGGIPNWQ